MSDRFLLDTCTVVWMAQGASVAKEARDALNASAASGEAVSVSVMTAWELGMLIACGRLSTTKSPERWYGDFLRTAEVGELAATAEILLASCFLPQLAHKDPFDRVLIATAREHDLTIITRDRAILAYGAAGHVKTLAC
ncbi:type II toxin-antitoxin system VapC family toxin [Martelella lutilitoris]|uniref:Type II toxin-antitoxin system VapC family toxin n=1 Tax=Martelella lutilitoris TaxID=2583532 RepID=A0A7T7KMZ3_9HYPH|nr:type II toxin-antitoxin system VapC family toxin [Martelella lutilitoris]QQM32013.1 type II toxin-antitoxin system VapC family toxin [Martelella lutilitoris]